MKHGAHMDIKHRSDDAAWVCLHQASKSLCKAGSQALSAPARKSLTALSAMAANPMHTPSRAARSWPIRDMAARRAFSSCPSEGMSRACCCKSWWCSSVCVCGALWVLIHSEAPGSAPPETNACTLGKHVQEICFLYPSRFLRKPFR